jgi:myo-inositol-1(or 4)-monophosphatase
VTDWLAACRAAVEDVRQVLVELPTRTERAPVVGEGVGGDETTAIDAAAESAIVGRLEAVHRAGTDFTLVSEELGERAFGNGATWVVVDPIDGSVNAKRGIPFFSFSLAVANGPRMGDVSFGYVYDFGSGEEWTAERGGGTRLNGEPLDGTRPKEEIEILSFEATVTPRIADHVEAFRGVAERLRVMGSLALSLCHLAAGRVDAVCSLKAARAVDIAAAQLFVRESGLAIDLPDDPPFDEAPLDAVGRSRVVAAATPELCGRLYAALSA